MLDKFRILLVGLALVAGPMLAPPTAAAEPVTLTILHINDMDQMSVAKGRGGVAKLAAVIAEVRASAPNVLVTHGGDMISPSLLSGFDKGAHMVDLMNRIGLDLMVLGNHEFDFGPDVTKQRLAEARFVWLGSNVTEAGAVIAGAAESHMIEVGGYKLGFFGITTPDTPDISSPGPTIAFAGYAETAARLVPRLREAGADIVVAVAHQDYADDIAMITDRLGVDVVLAGHDHVLAAYYDGRGVVLQSASQANYVGRLDITMNRIERRGRQRFVWRPDVSFVSTNDVAPDPTLAAAVGEYEARLSAELDIEIGATRGLLDSRRASVRSGETAIGNLIADAMRQAVGADIALTNGGGIRGDRTYEAGTVLTRRDILTELPFGNITVLLALDGAAVRAALEHGLAAVEKGSGRFPQLSGVRLKWNPKAPAGARLVDVQVGGAALDDGATYRFATNDFTARGGDGYTVFKGAKRLIDTDSGQLLASQVIDHIVAAGGVTAAIEGRIVKTE